MPGWLARGAAAPSRVARVAAAAGLGAVGLVAVPGAAATSACPRAIHHYADGWEEISLPAGFVTDQHALVDYALDTSTTDHLLATNGDGIVRSTDGGCSWQDATLPQAVSAPTVLGDKVSPTRRTISQVRVTPYTGVSWAIGRLDVEVNNSPLTQPVVLTSGDGGHSFAAATSGLPVSGQPLDLEVVPGTPAAFVLLRQLEGTNEDLYSIYQTTDAGASWTQAYTGLPKFSGMTVGFSGAGPTIWAWTDSGLYRSVAGAPFAAVPGVSGAVRTVDVSPGLTSVFFADGASRMVSSDGGSTWRRRPAPENVTSATHGPMAGLLAISSSSTTTVEVDPPPSAHQPPFDASPYETNVGHLQMSMSFASYGFLLYGANSSAIFRFEIPASFLYTLPPLPVAPRAKAVRVKARQPMLRTPELSPNTATVTLAPRQHRDIPYRLLLPPTPTPLDVYFMTDSTGSMATTIGSVQESIQQIVDDLASTGVNAHFGVADFRDFPIGDSLVATDDWADRRDRAVGPVDDAFAQALQSIQAGGGTTDGEDSGLEAIYQAVTGAGRKVVTDPTGNSDIAPNEGADFRPGAVKVVVVAADAQFRHPEGNPGWPGPTLAAVEQTLVQSGVHLVGLDVNTGSGQDPGPDMRALASASHTVAGPAGVDCDGDGTPDLHEGDPLVCPYSPNSHDSIAPAFLGLLDSLRDYKPVSLGVVGPRDVVRPLGATAFPQVNVKAVNTFGVPLEFRCDPPRFGTSTAVRVVAAVAGHQVASLPVTVKCGAPTPPLPPAPPQPLLALPPLAAIAAAAPPAPPTQPNYPNPQPNPQPQTQPNAGVASQEDQAQQLAFAEEGLTPADEPGLAMSAIRPQSSLGSSVAEPSGGPSVAGSQSDERTAAYLLAAGTLLALGAACRTRVSRRWSWERN
ncbi:MAG: VWA domain-containing protein [Frankiaceae bacterium]|nr:VWA domain-containing protein [Frankiaceae bacterium]MBV9368734.1 VWA domain-containing protein [Frankiales bacterium]